MASLGDEIMAELGVELEVLHPELQGVDLGRAFADIGRLMVLSYRALDDGRLTISEALRLGLAFIAILRRARRTPPVRRVAELPAGGAS